MFFASKIIQVLSNSMLDIKSPVNPLRQCTYKYVDRCSDKIYFKFMFQKVAPISTS